MTEQWRPVDGYEGIYSVSDCGNVFSHRINRNLKHGFHDCGYPMIWLARNGKGRTEKVHRLVAKAFLQADPFRKQVNHKDGNPRNNHAANLEWCTPKENSIHRTKVLRKQLGEDCPTSKLSNADVFTILKMRDGHTTAFVAGMFNVSPSTIWAIWKGKNWGHLQGGT